MQIQRFFRRTWLPAVASLFLAGCSTPYQVTMQDGTVIDTVDEPEADTEGFYEFENTATGKVMRVNKDEIVHMQEK